MEKVLGAIEFFDKHGDAVTALFTIALAVSTIGLWQTTSRLWRAGERQIEVARVAAIAAQQSAEATREAVQLASATAEHQLRAYLQAHTIRLKISDLNIGNSPEVTYALTNNGQTPAYRIHRREWIAVLPEGSEIQPALREISSHTYLAPNRSTENPTFALPITDSEQLAALRTGASRVFLAGEFEYTDAFGKIRFTRFAAKSRPPRDVRVDGFIALGLIGGGARQHKVLSLAALIGPKAELSTGTSGLDSAIAI